MVQSADRRPERSRAARLTAYSDVATSLAFSSDRALSKLVDDAAPLGVGIGGKSAVVEVAGTPVFVKRVPLTDLERKSEHVQSTANLFELPDVCHYGVGTIGTPGFGAWRELAVHAMTTNSVLAGEFEGFPLMYHWRVLPDSVSLPDELADVERAVAYWGGGVQMRHRIEAVQDATTSITLFLEYIPQNLHQWFDAQIDAGNDATDRACAMVQQQLDTGIGFMNNRGLLHFDAHFENILTDGQRLYFTDYGLAICSQFELSPAEADFFGRHQDYDRGYAAAYVVNWLVTALRACRPDTPDGRYDQVRAYAQGERPAGMPAGAAALITRHAPIAAIVSQFNRTFQHHSRRTEYPAEAIRQLGHQHHLRAP